MRDAWRRRPLWFRWLSSVAVFAGLLAGVVIAFRSGGTSPPVTADSGAIAAEQQTRLVIAKDEAPRQASLVGAPPAAALERGIAMDVRGRIRRDELQGTAGAVRCVAGGAQRGRREPFRCRVRVGGIGYTFFAVADLRARRITWCKRDPPAVGDSALDVPISPACRG